MNLICSIFLTFYMVFRPLIPLVEYAVNYNYISTVLCINKSKPELHCNGKCYVSKELAKTNDSDSSPLNKTKSSGQKIIDICTLPEIISIQKAEKFLSVNFNFLYETAYSFLFLKHIFKPPVF
ncbi:hypothetical protein EG346_04165 [Chryseobacterium carnipullorum]|uniref:Uncharacterized protein n=2 Tax=Chryseobacterium carnipullorum TaxID=1124835 RepID=A0A376EKE9_CHRCU|nr:hypothetical protein [Chryseobacterium carnipullorum]MDN5421776.1 hypothetical protein [Chryseobacterium sp.]AZA47425.1 hypothetical protein EG346_04165 [Chryseobacterium carnipullorum]AZA66763.1 hypothetical protein EG345_20285 [Chryseobacterium carnipullorum]MDN5477952.1 hypothetical protein [Chryseobacterium sp.]STD09908.1 Uncharacterised protein [Chryseobacterium carnipullorum]